MDQNQRLDLLLEKLKEDSIEYKDLEVADDPQCCILLYFDRGISFPE